MLLIHPRTSGAPIVLQNAYDDSPAQVGLGFILTKLDDSGNDSVYEYDWGGRMVTRKLTGHHAGGKVWNYSYSPSGRLLSHSDGNGALVKYGYDTLFRPDKRWLAQAGTQPLSLRCVHEEFAYDDYSRLVNTKTFQGNFGDLNGPNPAAPLLVETTTDLDVLGRQRSAKFGFGDGVAQTPAIEKTFTSTWTMAGGEDFEFRRGLSTPSGITNEYVPDANGRLSRILMTGQGLSGIELARYRYSGAQAVGRSHRLESGNNRIETSFAQNLQGFQVRMTARYGTGLGTDPVVYDQALVRDLVGNIKENHSQKVDGSAGDRLSYDGYDRLLAAELGVDSFAQTTSIQKQIDYAIDQAHNRNSVTTTQGTNVQIDSYAVTQGTNQYESLNGDPFTYDGNGNLISDGYYQYVYDYLNRLSEVYLMAYPAGFGASTQTARFPTVQEQRERRGIPSVIKPEKARQLLQRIRKRVEDRLAKRRQHPHLPLTKSVNDNQTSTRNEPVFLFVAQYGYDSFNRRVSKLSLQEETWYGYDGWQLREEYDLGWSEKVVYFDGGGINEHLGFAVRNGSTWTRYAIIQDQQGSVVRVLDAQGQTVARYEYDPYGRRTLVQGTLSFNLPYGFTGAYLDQETGIYYNRNRYYDARTGRFLTIDPLGQWFDGAHFGNGYAFGWSTPATGMDPSGQWFFTALIGGLVGAAINTAVALATGGDVASAAASGFVEGFIMGTGAGLLGMASKARKAAQISKLASKARRGSSAAARQLRMVRGISRWGSGAPVAAGASGGATGNGLMQLARKAVRKLKSFCKRSANHTTRAELIGSAEDVLENPSLLTGHTPTSAQGFIDELVEQGWQKGSLTRGSRAGKGLVLRETKNGQLTGRIIQWHPGGGHHGSSPYWKVSSGEGGTVRVFD